MSPIEVLAALQRDKLDQATAACLLLGITRAQYADLQRRVILSQFSHTPESIAALAKLASEERR